MKSKHIIIVLSIRSTLNYTHYSQHVFFSIYYASDMLFTGPAVFYVKFKPRFGLNRQVLRSGKVSFLEKSLVGIRKKHLDTRWSSIGTY